MKNKTYSFKIFSQYKNNIVYGFSTKEFGSIKNNGIINYENLKKFLRTLNIDSRRVIFAKQVHGKSVFMVEDLGKNIIEDTDGLITKQKNIFLGIVTADCLPLIFYDPVLEALGVCHAGYKGILSGIINNMVDKFEKSGSKTESIRVGIGPSIGVCCYNVSRDRIDKFEETFGKIKNMYRLEKDDYFLDLKTIVLQFLLKYGIKQENIEILPICTKCHIDKFYSFRGDSRETFGEFVTLAGMV